MALSIEWTRRIDNWRREIRAHFYRPLGPVELQGFVTRDQLPVERAGEGAFEPMPAGTRWGAKWEYCWFKGTVTIPRAAAGHRLVLKLDPGGESLVFINGKAHAARDREHELVTVSRRAKAGERFEILAEAYAGHGPLVHSIGPNPTGRVPVPEPGPAQAVVGESSFGVWEEEIYQLAVDVETLWSLRNGMDADSLRVSEIDAGLRDFTTIVDFELPREKMAKTVQRCRGRLAPLLRCRNGSTSPVMHAFGHAHLDLAWLWPLAETERKAARTFATQLGLMEEYRGFRFLQSQPHLYVVLKDRYPELYQRIRKAVKAGNVIPEGGMWVEADTNITGGESLIRQLLHGTRFFRREFGVESGILWLPDVFGYSGALPQILRGCGIRYFSTAKIFWNYNGGDPFPYNTFQWEGIDGSIVLAHFTNDYNSRTDPLSVITRWKERAQKNGIAARLLPFGFGDGGGGPTRDHLEYVRRLADLEGAPRVRYAHPLDFFRAEERKAADLPRYVGELYFQAHRGTYTSQARTKRANRKSEVGLREAELWSSFAHALLGRPVPERELEEAWKLVLLNQFHDIIPGSSIARVYDEALAAHDQVQGTASRIAQASIDALAGKSLGKALAIFNSLSWERTALVELPGSFSCVKDPEGRELPIQAGSGKTWVEVRIPSCGWASVSMDAGARRGGREFDSEDSQLRVARRLLENERIAVAFNDRGEITSIRDKEADRELASGTCNRLRMFKDVPTSWDAWDIDSMYPLTPVDLPDRARIEVLDRGPLVARMRISRRINESDLTQVVSLRRGSRRVDFETMVEWRESHKLLKVCFPVDYRSNEALHEIQFGHIPRPAHQSRQFDADRFEVSAHRWSALAEEGRGFAVLNDCKYGVNVLDGSINLTLLRSPLAPDMNADKGRQTFTYSFFSWNGALASSGLQREGWELNVPVATASGNGGSRSLLRLNAPTIALETVKQPEEGVKEAGHGAKGRPAGALVLRLSETMRTSVHCVLSLDLPVASAEETDMRERPIRELEVKDGRIRLRFRPFEVKTLRIRMKPEKQ